MSDAQNEHTNSRNRRRGQSPRRGKRREDEVQEPVQPAAEPFKAVATDSLADNAQATFVRPDGIPAPKEKLEVYCQHHMVVLTEQEPANIRPNSEMTTLRHLAVDRFGEATLFCDCLHNGSHEWPPTLQKLQTVIGLDQFLNASTNEA